LYSPVLNWSTIHLLLIITIKFKLVSCKVDYVQDFPQEKLSEDVFMRIPQGFYYKDSDNKDYVLKLKRYIYSLKQASVNWIQLLTYGLELVGFKESKIDTCLFINPSIICFVYVDDTLFFPKKTNK